jgi:hypothetical protein
LGAGSMAKSYKTRKGYRKWKDSGRYVHRTQAEKKIGGRLWPGRVVHHKNRNRQDNRMENLQVMRRSEHSAHHAKKRRWFW